MKKGEGKTVLILPGWGTVTATYNTLINSISTYANVYCLDMPGFGGSSEPMKSWNTDDFVDFVIKFIEKENIKELDLIGHSNGGRIIIKLLNRKDLSFKVNRIILMGSAGIVNEKPLLMRIKVKFFKFCKKLFIVKLLLKKFPKLLNKVGSEDYRNASPTMKKTMVNVLNEDLREYLPNIKQPTLLIWGTNDTATPISDGETMEKLIPNAGLVRIKGGTHYAFIEHAQHVNSIVKNFLDNK